MPSLGHTEAEDIVNNIARRVDYKRISEAASRVVAEDLNWNPYHFLLELVQNADDSSFTNGVQPWLSLAYSGYLKLKCNENGFVRKDVEAICGLGVSTKQNSEAVTGEKGIGFKSVFRVADAVWISSGGFTFVLSKTDMYKPKLFQLPFPDGSTTERDGTCMCFQITSEQASTVYEALDTFDAMNMVFLRQLQKIDITVNNSTKRLYRRETRVGQGFRQITIRENDNPLNFCIVLGFDLMPSTSRNAGIQPSTSTTNISLAFPVSSDFGRIQPHDSKVYACLPIADFGFKFAINANFVLTASRENIHTDSVWNRELRDKIGDVFVEAVTILDNTDSDLRYSWPLLLDFPSGQTDSFFLPAVKTIMRNLQGRKLLRNENGDKVCPKDVLLVPNKYRLGENGESPVPSKRQRYLSSKYDHCCGELLKQVGVREMDRYSLLRDLEQFMRDEVQGSVSSNEVAWYNRPDETWHINIAKVIINGGDNLSSWLRRAKMIPIEDGNSTWVAAIDTEDLYFATEDDVSNPLPQLAGLQYVPWEAHRNQYRRQLFESWGVKDPMTGNGIRQITKKIQLAHNVLDANSSKFTVKEIVSHARFLFKTRENELHMKKAWVVTQSGDLNLACETFIRPPVFSGKQLDAPALHEDYFQNSSGLFDGDSLLQWMTQRFQMLKSSRIASWDGNGYSLSPEAKSVFDKCSSFEILEFLRQHHSPLLDRDSDSFQPNIRSQIVSIVVHCQDGNPYPLNKTILPSAELLNLHSIKSLPLLPIAKYRNSDWEILTKFGVMLEPHSSYWIDCLQALRTSHPKKGSTTHSLVQYIYSRMHACCRNQTVANLRSLFMEQDLIFIHSMATSLGPKKDTWVNASQCIWDCPRDRSLRHTFTLSSTFPDQKDFFLMDLGIEPSVTWGTLQNEMLELNNDVNDVHDGSHTALQYMRSLLESISCEITCMTPDDRFQAYEFLRSSRILPVSNPNSILCFDRLVRAIDEEEWFISDQEVVSESFGSTLPLLSLGLPEVDGLEDMLSSLDMDRRRLSHVAVASSTVQATEDETFAYRLMQRAIYIDRLVSDSPSRRLPPMRKMTIKTFVSDVVSIIWKVNGYQSKSIPRVALVAFDQTSVNQSLYVYMQKGHLSSPQALMELSDDLCTVFKIPPTRRLLLQFVLASDNPREIENMLNKKKIPELSYDREFEETKMTNDIMMEAHAPLPEHDDGLSVGGTTKDKEYSASGYEAGEARSRSDDDNSSRSNPEEIVDTGRLRKLKRYTIARRLQESSVRELIMQSSIPSEAIIQKIDDSSRTQELAHIEGSMEEIVVGVNWTSENTHPSGRLSNRKNEEPLRHNWKIRQSQDVIQQFSGNIYASMLFRQSAPTNILFVTDPKDLPPVSHYNENEDAQTRAVLEARLRIPKDDGERYLYTLMAPFVDANNDATEFLGQIWVSQLLSNHLQNNYLPTRDWRSPLCAKLYSKVVHNEEYNELPFELHDFQSRRDLTHFLVQNSYKRAEPWQRHPPVYYIDVATSANQRSDPVLMTPSRFHKARKYRIPWRGSKPEHVLIFVRISNINPVGSSLKPEAAFYIDPWHAYTDSRMDIMPCNDKYQAIFKGKPDFSIIHVESKVYKWMPLAKPTTIRLLELHPASDSDPLEGTLTEYDLDDSANMPSYTAVSYAWGSALKQFSLHIRGGVDPILLPASLYLAIRRLRNRKKPRILWADAICIDQNSNKEKEAQILLLSRIFQSAQKVFAWIGDEDDQSAATIQFLRGLGNWVLETRSRAHHVDRNALGQGLTRPPLIPQPGDQRWMAVRNLFKRPWFSRLWIVQEAVLASELDIGCGRELVSWEVFHAGASFCFINGLLQRQNKHPITDETTQKNILQLGNLRNETRITGKFCASDSIFRLLQLFHQKCVSQPRDRLFALLSMANDDEKNGKLRPNYEDSEEDIITAYATVFVQQGFGLDLLYMSRVAWDRKMLPSWMPRLTDSAYPKTISRWNDKFTAAGQHFKSPRQERVIGRKLCLNGFVVDEISNLGRHASNVDNVILYLESIYETIDTVYQSMTNEQRFEVSCRLPIGDTEQSATGSWDWKKPDTQKASSYTATREYLSQQREIRSWSSEAQECEEATQADFVVSPCGRLRERMWPYLKTAMEFAECFQPASAVVCVTKNGRVGIVPHLPCCQPGDKVVIFDGAKVPYLIRESESDDGAYQAVGECYIDGYMYGEAFDLERRPFGMNRFELE